MKAFPSTLIALLCCLGLQAQNLDFLRMRIDSIITSHPLMEQASCGIMVYDATADNVIYKHEEKKLHRPASTAKLFTCATALRFLGADYGIHTSIHTTGKTDKIRVDGEQKKVLEGDLFIKGNFDPTFSSADLDTLLLKAFVQEEIDSIVGNGQNLYVLRPIVQMDLDFWPVCKIRSFIVSIFREDVSFQLEFCFCIGK